jgi:hypothetical protein
MAKAKRKYKPAPADLRREMLPVLEALRRDCPAHRKDWRRTIDGYINRLKLYSIAPEAATVEQMRRVIYGDESK